MTKCRTKHTGHGGARAGAGRKRDRLPQRVLDRLGIPPKDDAAKLDLWVRGALAELVVLVMCGEVSSELAASVRATCAEIRRQLPASARGSEPDDDDSDDTDDSPELEEMQVDDALRVER